VRLGGYVIVARMLDKGRAMLAGTEGDYHYDCPVDKRFLEFAGVDATAVKEQLATGAGDGDVLNWINANSTTKPSPVEIEAWSNHQEQRSPGDLDSREFFSGLHKGAGPDREDINTWFDLLDLDDFVSFGGIAAITSGAGQPLPHFEFTVL
jgi:hypothetical protein